MRKRLYCLLCLMLIVLTAAKVPGREAPRQRGGPARQRGTARRRPSGDQSNLQASREDLDYQSFFREVPQDRFDEAVAESAGPEARGIHKASIFLI